VLLCFSKFVTPFRFLQSELGLKRLKADNALSMLLLGTILLDTINLKWEMGKTTANDVDVVDLLVKMWPEVLLLYYFN
jgi:hypothetical protein